jgi:hypothetical protein
MAPIDRVLAFPATEEVQEFTNAGGSTLAAGTVTADFLGRSAWVQTDIPAGATGAVLIRGDVEVDKPSDLVLTRGQLVDWDAVGKTVVAVGTGTRRFGRVVYAAGAGVLRATVRLNDPEITRSIDRLVTGAEDTADAVTVDFAMGRVPVAVFARLYNGSTGAAIAVGGVTVAAGGAITVTGTLAATSRIALIATF